GAATPVGHAYDAVADNLLAGRSGVRPVAHFPVTNHLSRIAGWIDAVPCPPGWDAAEFARLSRHEQALVWCCVTALRDAGCWELRREVRVGLVLGIGAEWIVGWEADRTAGGGRIFDPRQEAESLAHTVRRKLQLSGPVVTLSAACAGGNYALEQGRRWLELGWADVCLAGACEMAVTPMGLAGFG